jgi:hypothetical protein
LVKKIDQEYYPRKEKDLISDEWRLVKPPKNADHYRGGMGGGKTFSKKVLPAAARNKIIHTNLVVDALEIEHEFVHVPDHVKIQYARTVDHLVDLTAGHFSARHPNVGKDRDIGIDAAATVGAAARNVFQENDLIWVEWDTLNNAIVSIGWHYYYRWAYQDTVRKLGGGGNRPGLFPLEEEKGPDAEGAPLGLSPVRRLFGYVSGRDDDPGIDKGSAGIGSGDHTQLMGRISVNAAIEVIEPGQRFLGPTFLKELGQPRPSAVEHYLRIRGHRPMRDRPDRIGRAFRPTGTPGVMINRVNLPAANSTSTAPTPTQTSPGRMRPTRIV